MSDNLFAGIKPNPHELEAGASIYATSDKNPRVFTYYPLGPRTINGVLFFDCWWLVATNGALVFNSYALSGNTVIKECFNLSKYSDYEIYILGNEVSA